MSSSAMTETVELKPLQLPKHRLLPATSNAGVEDRKSTRSFRNEKIPVQTLSNLLWAAFGVTDLIPENERPLCCQLAGNRYLRGNG